MLWQILKLQMCATDVRMPVDIKSMSAFHASQAAGASGSDPLPRAKAQKGSKRRIDDDDDTSECDTASEADEDHQPVAPLLRTSLISLVTGQ